MFSKEVRRKFRSLLDEMDAVEDKGREPQVQVFRDNDWRKVVNVSALMTCLGTGLSTRVVPLPRELHIHVKNDGSYVVAPADFECAEVVETFVVREVMDPQ